MTWRREDDTIGCMIKKLYIFASFFLFAFLVSGCLRERDRGEIYPVLDNRDFGASLPGRVALTVSPTATPVRAAKQTLKPTAQSTIISAPASLLIPVPFTSQAPFALWDDLHNEACEEASMIMADTYFKKSGLTKEIAEKKIQEIVKWQTENGYTYDITAREVVEILVAYYGLNAELDDKVTVENIIIALNNKKLIIMPAAGRMLGNPNFRRPGPLYHMLVIKGYDQNKKEFITNDPGTRKGEGYRYSYNTLLDAIHDWPRQGAGKDDVTGAEMMSGRKVMIIVSDK